VTHHQDNKPGALPPSAAGCLHGIRVIELGQFLSAPYGGMILSDLGAEVIKVEMPGRGDDGRRMGAAQAGGDALIFCDLNRGKKSVAVDIKSAAERERLMRLMGTADIVINNLRPGVVEACALDGPTLLQRFPRLVYCDLSAFGHEGPMRLQPGFEPLAQAFSGLSSINGYPDGGPTRTGPSIVDLGSGMWIALAALAALLRRQRDGRGSVIRLSLLETALGWISADVSGYLNEGRFPQRRGNGQPLLAPYDVFPASDGAISLAIGNDAQFRRFAAELGHPEWADAPEFATNVARIAHKAALADLIAERLKTRTRDEWIDQFQQSGVPCSKVNTIPEALESAQVASLQMVRTSPVTGRASVGLPFTMDGFRPGSLSGSPFLGVHDALLAG